MSEHNKVSNEKAQMSEKKKIVLVLPADDKSKHLAKVYSGSSSSALPVAFALQVAPP